MDRENEELHVDMEAARGASTPNIVRWVLTISLAAAIVLLTAIWVIGAWSGDHAEPTASASIRAQQGRGANDSIVSDQADRMDAATPGRSEDPQNIPNRQSTGEQ